MDTKTLSDFDRSIKALRRSKLAKTPEFNNMVLASERFHRDAKLASLTRKDPNQMGQMFEDGQFFGILLGMLTEVSRSSGLKQRDDLRKVYHWYQMNKDVLHCRPHFQSVSTPPNKSPPELKFSPEVIKYYSLPPDKRKSKQVEFKDSDESSLSTQNEGNIRKSSNLKGSGQRPVTAPPVLSRPKVENTLPSNLRKSWRGQQFFVEESGLSITYINKHLTPKKYMAALERPSSAMAIVRQYQQSLDPNLDDANDDDDDDVSSDGKLSISLSTDLHTEGSQSGMPPAGEDVSGSGMPPAGVDVPGQSARTDLMGDPEDKNGSGEDGQITADASSINDETGKEVDGKVDPIPVKESESKSVTNNQVTPHSFINDESYGDGAPPDEKKYATKKIEVSIPAVGDESASVASQVNLQKWHEYQQSHSSFHSNIAMPTGNSQSEGMMVEMPELSTNQVIAEYAEKTGPVNIPGSAHYDQSQSLEDFYKASEKFSPSVNPRKPSARKQLPSRQPTQPVGKLAAVGIHPDEQTRDVVVIATQQEANHQDKSLHLDSVVDLAGPVSDQMVLEKESQEDLLEPRLRHRMPSAQIPPPRPHTALGHSSRTHVTIPDGRTRTSPASTPRSSLGSQESPRTSSGDALVGHPSHYDVHFRRKARPVTAPTHIPHAVQRTPIRPDSTRYRSKSASPRASLRTAGSTSGGGRPRTASSLRYTEWTSVKPLGSKIRVPGAASHSSLTIHPLTISAMMSVKHLGGTSSSFREQMNPKASRFWNNEDIPEDLPPNLEFMSISRPAPVHEGKLEEESDKTQKTSSGSENLDSLQQEEVRDWTSTHDSIEGLVQLGRARSERGGGDADSQGRDSLGGSSDRGLSPEPADLSDLENETPGVTPREEAVVRMEEDEGKFGGNDTAIDDKSKEDAAQKEDTADKEAAEGDGNSEEKEFIEGSENVIGKESQADQKSDRASESENVGSDTAVIAFEEGKMDGSKSAFDDAQGEREDGTMEVAEDEAGCVERGETVEGKGKSVDEVETNRTVKAEPDEIERNQGERVGDGGTERSDSKVTFSIFESVDDEDYFEPPLVHLEDPQRRPCSVRIPQTVIPRVRDPSGQLVDAGLEVETYPKPLTPRDASQSQAVTISGTRQRPKSKKEEDALAVYLLTEEEPSPEEQSSWRIKADVQRKPLWERSWSRGYRRDAGNSEDNTVSGNSEMVTKYRLSLAEFEKKEISPGHPPTSGVLRNLSDIADEESLDMEPNSYVRRPQTPKRFEVLEPRPFKQVTDEWKGRPVPEVGGTFDEEAEMKAIERQRAAKQAVQIGKLFSKKADKAMKQMQKELEWGRWEKRWEEADAAERNHLCHLMRKEAALMNRSGVMDDDWEQRYVSQRHLLRQTKSKERKDEFMKRNKMSKREKTTLNRIGASLEIWDIFREGRRGTSKRQRRAAAIMIQKHVRGWLARLKFEKIKQKSRVHATSYKGFAKYYSKLMHRVARWHGVKSPVIHINLKEVDEFMDKKRYFENMFARRAYPRRKLEYRELKDFFRDCDLYPTQREMYNAVLGVTRKTPDDPHTPLTEEQVAEVAFMIYVPDGSGLDKMKTRQSTWLNPLVDGKEANKFIGSEEYYAAKLSKSMQLVFAAHKERVDREAAEKRKVECVSNEEEGKEEDKMTVEERKKHQLEAWIKKERERERLEEEKRRRPVREGELKTNYQLGEEGLLQEMTADDPTIP